MRWHHNLAEPAGRATHNAQIGARHQRCRHIGVGHASGGSGVGPRAHRVSKATGQTLLIATH